MGRAARAVAATGTEGRLPPGGNHREPRNEGRQAVVGSYCSYFADKAVDRCGISTGMGFVVSLGFGVRCIE